MNRRTSLKRVPAFTMLAATASSFAEEVPKTAAPAVDLQPIALLKPEKDGGKSVLASLWERCTIRSVSDKGLSPQMLSNLLWAAWGVNRESGPRGRIGRTAASASNSQEIDLYIILPEGVYLYEAAGHRLTPVAAGDHRAKAGRGQVGAMAKASVNLVYVADIARYSQGQPQEPGLKDPEIQKSYANVAIGLIAGVSFCSPRHRVWRHGCTTATNRGWPRS